MFIITIYTSISINIQKKRREMVRDEWKGMLIVRDDERDVVDEPWEVVIGC